MRFDQHLFVALACTSLFLSACSDDDDPPGAQDGGGSGGKATGGSGAGGKSTGGASTGGAGTGGTSTGGTGSGDDAGDAGPTQYSVCGGKTGDAQIECGGYIVKHVAACVDCHTPRNPDGSLDTTKALAGNPLFTDQDPDDAERGALPGPNLTTLTSRGWTAAQIKDAILNGNRTAARGGGLLPVMPYYTLHNMAPVDADAIVAFLLSLGPIVNDVPGRQPLPEELESIPFPIPPFDADLVPGSTLSPSDPDRALADYGRYLASAPGACMECHTERTPTRALDPTTLFAGGESFAIGGPFGTVVSANITPASNGITGWTAADVQKLIREGLDRDGEPACPPMPVGPNGAFGGITPADALAIGTYIASLPPIEHPASGKHPACTVPPPPDAGGSTDASTD